MKKIVSLAAVCLLSSVFLEAQRKGVTLSPSSFYNYALAALNSQAPNFDAIIADLFVNQGLQGEERDDELSTLVSKFGQTQGQRIKKFIEEFEDIKTAGGIDAFLNARNELNKCKTVTTVFNTFKQAVDSQVVATIKSTWQQYLSALSTAGMTLDADDRAIDSAVAALREKAPPITKPFEQTWQDMISARERFEKEGYSATDLPALRAAVEAADKQSGQANAEQQKMLIVAKSVVNVFAGEEVFKEPSLMTAAQVLTMAIDLAAPTNKEVRNAIAAAYYVIDEKDKPQVETAFNNKFGRIPSIKGLGLAVLVPQLKDAELTTKYNELIQCNPAEYRVNIND